MKMLDYAHAAGWKHDNAPGIRFFENPVRPAKLGYDEQGCVKLAVTVAKLGTEGNEFAIVWPQKLGSVPTIEQLEQWVQEWRAATSAQP